MKIVICSFTFAPQANGVAEVVREHATGLAALGHEVTVATTFDPKRAASPPIPGVTVREFNIKAIAHRKTSDQTDAPAYRQFISRSPMDMIICHCWGAWPTDLAFPVLSNNPAGKIFVSHGFAAHYWHRQRRFPWGLAQWMRQQPYVWKLPQRMRVFDHIVFLSERVDRARFFDHWLLQRFGGPRWSAIPNGTWPERFTGTREAFRTRHALGSKFVVLNVSMYAPTKGQEAALLAFSQSGIRDAVLIFIGNEINDYARELQRLAARLPFGSGSSVQFLERLDRGQICEAYQACDLFLFASRGETQPLVVLDAMASGRAFISTNVGCVSEFSGGVTVNNPNDMTHHLRTLRSDAPRLAELGKSGLAAARSIYYWPRIVAAYDRLIGSLATAKH
ncbi:MAG TPA: glycosyltransferase family 4 protein [Verrucomicrobiae bacterium]|nr:glycosyltransferase family 4 protein [Verrucomicrobiae bacterium]